MLWVIPKMNKWNSYFVVNFHSLWQELRWAIQGSCALLLYTYWGPLNWKPSIIYCNLQCLHWCRWYEIVMPWLSTYTGDNPWAEARGLSPWKGGQTILILYRPELILSGGSDLSASKMTALAILTTSFHVCFTYGVSSGVVHLIASMGSLFFFVVRAYALNPSQQGNHIIWIVRVWTRVGIVSYSRSQPAWCSVVDV